MSYCEKCGRKLKQGTKFCAYCGTSVSVKALRTSKELQARSKAPQKIGGPVIATIIAVVVIAVVIIVVLAAHFRGGGGLDGRGVPPNALLSVRATKVTNTSYTITISHEGGDAMNVADLQVMASSSSGTLQTLPFLNPSGGTTGTFSMGMSTTITCSYSPDVTGQVVTVYIIDKPMQEKIFSASTVAVQAGGYPAMSMNAASPDNHVYIEVLSGSIAAGQWAYYVGTTPSGSTSTWTTGTVALTAPSVDLGTYTLGATEYVNVKHISTGHIYFSSDQVVTVGST